MSTTVPDTLPAGVRFGAQQHRRRCAHRRAEQRSWCRPVPPESDRAVGDPGATDRVRRRAPSGSGAPGRPAPRFAHRRPDRTVRRAPSAARPPVDAVRHRRRGHAACCGSARGDTGPDRAAPPPDHASGCSRPTAGGAVAAALSVVLSLAEASRSGPTQAVSSRWSATAAPGIRTTHIGEALMNLVGARSHTAGVGRSRHCPRRSRITTTPSRRTGGLDHGARVARELASAATHIGEPGGRRRSICAARHRWGGR